MHQLAYCSLLAASTCRELGRRACGEALQANSKMTVNRELGLFSKASALPGNRAEITPLSLRLSDRVRSGLK